MKTVGFILAAGLGTRLRPSTERAPKPLLPVAGVEPLFFAIHRFYGLGIRRIVVNAHHLHAQIEEALAAWAPLFEGAEFRLSLEMPAILGTGGALVKVAREQADWLEGASLLVQNGDTLAHFDFAPLLTDPAANVFAVSTDAAHTKAFNPLWIDAQKNYAGRGSAAAKESLLHTHFLGVQHLSNAALKLLQKGAFKVESLDLFDQIYQPLIDVGQKFRGQIAITGRAPGDSFWFDLGTSQQVLQAQQYLFSKLSRGSVWVEALQRRHPGIREEAPGVWVASKAPMRGKKLLSPAVLVESGSVHRQIGALTVGPNVSFIDRHGSLSGGEGPGALEISNAVVLVSRRGERPLPACIRDEICVI